MSEKKKKADEPTYAAASAELEQILQDIESGEIDLDVLAEKVERAAALLALCRQKLAATETKVTKVTAELAAAMDDAPDDGASAEEAR
ncbi:MAG: exodeoxyribonuclease VII small subunit [Planctomycetes bacterium]|nr:exodeoxyribonuclease VII small subunit [Planctomycetota bacterium]